MHGLEPARIYCGKEQHDRTVRVSFDMISMASNGECIFQLRENDISLLRIIVSLLVRGRDLLVMPRESKCSPTYHCANDSACLDERSDKLLNMLSDGRQYRRAADIQDPCLAGQFSHPPRSTQLVINVTSVESNNISNVCGRLKISPSKASDLCFCSRIFNQYRVV